MIKKITQALIWFSLGGLTVLTTVSLGLASRNLF